MTYSEFQTRLLDHQDTLDPVREYLEWHFADAQRIKDAERPSPGYERRPTIGLRLQIEGDLTLAIRPGWTPPLKRAGRILDYGELHPGVVTLELLDPGKLLRLRLREGKPPSSGAVYLDRCQDHLRTILDAARDLLLDPEELFSRQSDKCCCCSKALTDVVSRTRGIGPECVRMFGDFAKRSKPPTSVERYREQYLAATGFYPGR